MSASTWIASGAIAALMAMVGVALWLATRKGAAEERARAEEKIHEIDEAMSDEMARPRDERGTVDKLRRGDF